MSFFEVKIDDADIRGALQRLIALGADTAPAMKAVAAIGEKSSRMRFRTQTGPDGKDWKPSLRVQLHGGRTLTKDGHLASSLSQNSGKDFAEWGVNRVYAAIHQFGGTIHAKGGALRFAIPGGGITVVKAVKMPARPFLGMSDDDKSDILDIFEHRIAGASGGAVHAG